MVEVLFRDVVVNSLTINDLLLGEGDVDRVWNWIGPIELFDSRLDQDNPIGIVWGIYLIFICSLSVSTRLLK